MAGDGQADADQGDQAGAAGSEPTGLSPAARDTPVAYRAVRGGLWVAASSYWTTAFGFAATLVMTRLLQPEAFGVFALAMFFVQLLRLQPKLGLGYAFAQHKGSIGQTIGTYFAMEAAAATGGLLLVLISVPVLLGLGYPEIVVQVGVILAASVMLEGLMSMGGVLLEKELQFNLTSIVQSIAFPLSYVPAVWLAFHTGSVWSLVAQNLVFNVLFLIGVWWVVRRRLGREGAIHWRLDKGLARRFLSFGGIVGLGMMAAMLLTQLDSFLIGTFVGVAVLGFYDRAYRTSQWPSTLFNGLISRTAFYTYAKLQDDPLRLERSATMMLWLITTLGVPLGLVIFITAPDLVVLLYGDRWLPSAIFLRILVVYSVVRPLWDNAGSLFIAMGKPRRITVLTAVQATVLGATGLPLTLLWGAVGTAVAVGMAFAIGVVAVYRDLVAQLALQLRETVGVPLLAAALTVAGYLVLSRLTGLNDLPLLARVLLKCLYAGGAFFSLTMAIQPRAMHDRVAYVWRLAKGSSG